MSGRDEGNGLARAWRRLWGIFSPRARAAADAIDPATSLGALDWDFFEAPPLHARGSRSSQADPRAREGARRAEPAAPLPARRRSSHESRRPRAEAPDGLGAPASRTPSSNPD